MEQLHTVASQLGKTLQQTIKVKFVKLFFSLAHSLVLPPSARMYRRRHTDSEKFGVNYRSNAAAKGSTSVECSRGLYNHFNVYLLTSVWIVLNYDRALRSIVKIKAEGGYSGERRKRMEQPASPALTSGLMSALN